jgi:asparagine synthase (glutamine-hydrolysing)
MLPFLAHRGPDASGVWTSGDTTLGHLRLAINDLSEAGNQPMLAYDSELALVVNGEIYNYGVLRAELAAQGALFRSNSDSEVILHAYRRFGLKAFERLNGMFALALFDVRASRLIIVRDRMGIKPVYYHHDPHSGALLFASEIKGILAATGRKRWQIDGHGLRQYLSHQNLTGDRSMFAGIKLLEPGSMLIDEVDGTRVERYWQATIPPAPPRSFSQDTDEFSTVFGRAVERHLMSDVPVASYMSAGFDSTLVASRAASLAADPPTAFTGTFGESGWYDELSGATLAARHIGAPIVPVPITAEDMIEHFDALIRALDEPRMGLGAISQFMVARAASKSHKVILSGHGGDELFSGYPVFKLAAILTQRSLMARLRILRSVRLSEVPPLVYFLGRHLMDKGPAALVPLLFGPAVLKNALSPAAAALLDRHQSPDEPRRGNLHEQLLLTYINVYLPGLLVVEDKISMAHALETRTPFLDNELVDLALRTSAANKLHGGQLKAIIKNEAKTSLPPAFLSFPKRGFPTPLARWLRGPLRTWAEARITAPDSALTMIFDHAFLVRTFARYQSSWRRHVRPLDDIQTHRMWMLLSLESWLRQTQEVLDVRLELSAAADHQI